MSSYQPPIETVSIFNSQSFPTTSYSGQHDPTKLDYPVAQGVPSMSAVNVTNGTNTSLITPTGITTSGTQGASTINTVQIAQKDQINTFTAQQTFSNGSNPTQHFGGIYVANSQIVNIAPRTALGYIVSLSPTTISGTVTGGGTTTMTISVSNSSIGVGSVILGTGVTAGTVVTAVVTAGTVFTLNQNLAGTPTAYINNTTLSFSLAQIYYYNPLTTSYTITLPTLSSLNVGAVATFRAINFGIVSTINLSSATANIFPATVVAGISSHNIYVSGNGTSTAFTGSLTGTTTLTTTGSPPLTVGTTITGGTTLAGTYITAINNANNFTVNQGQTSTPTNYILPTPLTTHTFMVLPTPLVAGGYGWFQLGTV